MFAKLGYSEEPINYYDEFGKLVPLFYYDLEADQLYHKDDEGKFTVWATFTFYSKKLIIICDRRQDIRDVWRRACELIKEDDDDADHYYMYSQGEPVNTVMASAGSIAKENCWCEIDVQWI